jgi:hypothetical protein
MDLTLILKKKYAGSVWTLNGNTYDGLTWLSDDDKPTEAEIVAYWDSVASEITAEAEAKAQAKALAEAKLEALGLTADDLKALGL